MYEERRCKQDNNKFMTACVDFEATKDKLQAVRVDHVLKTGQLPMVLQSKTPSKCSNPPPEAENR